MDVQPHLLNLSAYIDRNLDKDLPLSALAKRVGLSPFHFHRKFGAYFGESLHQHIKRLRLERAAFALMHGSSPVRQIARDSGYKTVSAFSHAFSGFAGESPTRYRALAAATDGDDGKDAAPLDPSWVGMLPAQEFAFVRFSGNGRGNQRPITDTLDLTIRLAGPFARGQGDAGSGATEPAGATAVPGSEDGAASPGSAASEASESSGEVGSDVRDGFIAATSDVYGVFRGGSFRVDVGMDAARLQSDRQSALGRQVLPGGRYARYDLRCRLDDVFAHCRRVSLVRLQQRGEVPRMSQVFVRFATRRPPADEREDCRLFVPLNG